MLAVPRVRAAAEELGDAAVRAAVVSAQDRARGGEIAPEAVVDTVVAGLGARGASSLTPVLNATGVVVHTNLGRAPLSRRRAPGPARRRRLRGRGAADLTTGQRSARGAGAPGALLEACPAAEDALVVTNGAAAPRWCSPPRPWPVPGRWSCCGEFVENRGRIPALGPQRQLTGAAARGGDHEPHPPGRRRGRSGPETGCILQADPSNFRVDGFTSSAPLRELRSLADEHGVPLVVDVGSGLLTPDPALPDQPSRRGPGGGDAVIASGATPRRPPRRACCSAHRDGSALARFPLARAVRGQAHALAALQATLRGQTAGRLAWQREPGRLRSRAQALAAAVHAAGR
ncbi:L-seryl-tRNA(Sec) selenium transferase [Kocuria rhizophila]|nr:L-seryl-tRNA(Sec) selenium transferase [Kocuria rhizophila]